MAFVFDRNRPFLARRATGRRRPCAVSTSAAFVRWQRPARLYRPRVRFARGEADPRNAFQALPGASRVPWRPTDQATGRFTAGRRTVGNESTALRYGAGRAVSPSLPYREPKKHQAWWFSRSAPQPSDVHNATVIEGAEHKRLYSSSRRDHASRKVRPRREKPPLKARQRNRASRRSENERIAFREQLGEEQPKAGRDRGGSPAPPPA